MTKDTLAHQTSKAIANLFKLQIYFGYGGDSFQSSMVTTKSYQDYYWAPKISKTWQKQHNKFSLVKKSFGRRTPQELEVGRRSGPYLLVIFIQ